MVILQRVLLTQPLCVNCLLHYPRHIRLTHIEPHYSLSLLDTPELRMGLLYFIVSSPSISGLSFIVFERVVLVLFHYSAFTAECVSGRLHSPLSPIVLLLPAVFLSILILLGISPA